MFDSGPTRQWVVEAVRERWCPTPVSEEFPLREVLGRVAAENVSARFDQPVVRASAMDGIGVPSALFADGMPDSGAWRLGHEYVRADTGDDFDDAYDAVVPIEKVTFADGGGLVLEEGLEVTAGLNVRPAGSSVAAGELLVRAGTRLTPGDVAALAAGGAAQVAVRRRPVVAFIPTGSELVALGSVPARGKVIDSNSVLVAGMLAEMGAEALCLPIVGDDPQLLGAALDTALGTADLVIINAGSSKGGEDFNARLLEERGELLCHGVAAAPGRPLAVAFVDGKPVLNVPGPPLATWFVMDWCTRALVAHALDVEPAGRPAVEAVLAGKVGAPPFMEILCRVELEQVDGAWMATPVPLRGASLPRAMCASAQFVTALGREGGYQEGEKVTVELLRRAQQPGILGQAR
jgi:molybdopterin molybdotransferase/putative molybdopterin biosynthesis protein